MPKAYISCELLLLRAFCDVKKVNVVVARISKAPINIHSDSWMSLITHYCVEPIAFILATICGWFELHANRGWKRISAETPIIPNLHHHHHHALWRQGSNRQLFLTLWVFSNLTAGILRWLDKQHISDCKGMGWGTASLLLTGLLGEEIAGINLSPPEYVNCGR